MIAVRPVRRGETTIAAAAFPPRRDAERRPPGPSETRRRPPAASEERRRPPAVRSPRGATTIAGRPIRAPGTIAVRPTAVPMTAAARRALPGGPERAPGAAATRGAGDRRGGPRRADPAGAARAPDAAAGLPPDRRHRDRGAGREAGRRRRGARPLPGGADLHPPLRAGRPGAGADRRAPARLRPGGDRRRSSSRARRAGPIPSPSSRAPASATSSTSRTTCRPACKVQAVRETLEHLGHVVGRRRTSR